MVAVFLSKILSLQDSLGRLPSVLVGLIQVVIESLLFSVFVII